MDLFLHFCALVRLLDLMYANRLGIIWGWASLLQVLEKERVYYEECPQRFFSFRISSFSYLQTAILTASHLHASNKLHD